MTPGPGTATNPSARTGIYLVHAAFVLTGVTTTMLGPMLPLLSSRWMLSDAQAGYLFTAQFAASILGASLSALLVPRCGYRMTLLLGLSLMAIAAGVLAEASWTLGLTAVFLNGAGLGVTIPAGNLWVADTNPEKRASAVSLLNFSWGVGAVSCPFAFAALQRSLHGIFFLYGLAALLALLSICFAFSPFPSGAIPAATTLPQIPRGIWTSRATLLLAALFFLYVGTEGALGGWVATYAQRIESASQDLWAMAPSFFWGALLAGRAATPALLRFLRETRLATAGLALAVLGVTLLLAANTLGLVLFSAALAGLGLASVYPISISLLSRWFGDVAARIGGIFFAIAGLGGAILPWMVGTLSTRFGNLKVGLLVPLLTTALMLVLYLANGNARPETRTILT